MLSILHISDLHRDRSNPISNSALLESLVRDRDRYADEAPAPSLVIVSGDIVAGVAPTTTDVAVLAGQYEEAERFLSDLAERFVGGDHQKVVLVPGNHDVSYPEVMASLKPVDLKGEALGVESLTKEYVGRLREPGSPLRWSWQTLSFFEVEHQDRYSKRFEAFAAFYGRFYGATRTFSLAPDKQVEFFDYPGLALTVVGFNSCYCNDPLNTTASIHPDCIAEASRVLREGPLQPRLRLAVWHHSTNGTPMRGDYMDADTLQVLMDCGFVIGVHGHQHKPQVIDERFQFGRDRKLTVIAAGTVCGGREALPTGQRRAYNVIVLDLAEGCGSVHVRQMENDNLASPVWGPAQLPSRRSSVDFTFEHVSADLAAVLVEAEQCLSTGRPMEAASMTKAHVGTSEPARRIHLEALHALGESAEIVSHFFPPRGVTESVYLADALWAEGDRERLRILLATAEVRDSLDPAIIQIRDKYSLKVVQ